MICFLNSSFVIIYKYSYNLQSEGNTPVVDVIMHPKHKCSNISVFSFLYCIETTKSNSIIFTSSSSKPSPLINLPSSRDKFDSKTNKSACKLSKTSTYFIVIYLN